MHISFIHLHTFWKRAAAMLAVVLISTAVYAQITPSQDAYTNSADPTTNYGAATLLYVDGATDVTYIQFNLASIPSGATVSQATLKLYVNAVTTAGSFNVDYVLGSWSESTITHNLAPALGNTIVSSVPITTASKNQYILINITPAVQAWLSGSEPNDGIALVANSTFNASFDSKENTGTSHPAELDIVFEGPITGVTTAAGSGLTGGGTSGTLNLSLETNCASGQVLEWNGSEWACSSPGGIGTITGVTAGTGLTGSGTSGNVTLNVNEGVVAFQSDLTNGVNTAETFATTAASTAQTNAEAYAVPLAGGTMTGALNLPGLNLTGPSGTGLSIGGNLFDSGNYASSNAFLGFSGNATMTGTANTAVGYQALLGDTTGWGNTAVGDQALVSDNDGYANIAVGGLALSSNVSGSQNTATGGLALRYATSSFNTADGNGALSQTTTGGSNTAVGTGALLYNTTGSYNTALGYQAAYDHNFTGLSNATAIGAQSDVTQNNALVLGSINGVNGATASANVGIGTTAPQFTLDVEAPSGSTPTVNFGSTSNPAALTVNGTANFTGLVSFSSGQAFPGTGSGTITGVTAGTGLTGGGTSGTVVLNVDTTKVVTGVLAGTGLTGGGTGGNVTLNLDTTQVPLLSASNTFTGNQTVNGNVSATGVVTGTGFQIGSNLFAFGSYTNSNAFLGFAGNSATTGSSNTASGAYALASNTTGSGNLADGEGALIANTTGYNNTASGAGALSSNSTGQWNTASGYGSLPGNSTGHNNTAIGANAGTTVDSSPMTSLNNTFVGANASASTGTLSNAAAIGANAEVGESNALVLGCVNGVNSCPAAVSIGIGTATPAYALDVHGTGNFTGAVTFGTPVTFAAGQTFPGAGAGTITGVTAGTGLSGGGTSGAVTLNNTGVLGVTAGTGITSSGGQIPTVAIDASVVPLLASANTFTGNQTVSGNLSATGVVTGSGFQIGSNLFDYGSYSNGNAFLGFAGNTTMTGTGNTASGAFALNENTTGAGNTASGYLALYSNTTANLNTAGGFQALYSNTTGSENTALGYGALIVNTTGSENTAVGEGALGNNTTGTYNTALGYSADAGAVGLTNATAIGANAYVAESNALVLGSINGINGATSNTSVGIGTYAPAYIFQIAKGLGSAYADGWATYSSRRWKTNIQTLPDALAKVEQLRGVSYDRKGSGKHEIGVIAEEVGAVVPEVVSYEKNGKDASGVDYGRLTALLIEAVKQQQKEISALRTQLRRRAAKEAALESRLERLEQERGQSQLASAHPVR